MNKINMADGRVVRVQVYEDPWGGLYLVPCIWDGQYAGDEGQWAADLKEVWDRTGNTTLATEATGHTWEDVAESVLADMQNEAMNPEEALLGADGEEELERIREENVKEG